MTQLPLVAAAILLWAPASFSAEEPAAKPPAIDVEQNAAEHSEQQSPPDEQQLTSRIISSLAEASQRLDDGVVDDSTIAIQQSAARDIEALLKNLKENSQPSSSPDSGSSPAQDGAGQLPNRSNRRPNQNRDAANSSEQAREGAPDNSEGEIQRRHSLAQSVWGHLPPKVQEELERAFSERFAPRYEELIRRYYEALAERPRPKP